MTFDAESLRAGVICFLARRGEARSRRLLMAAVSLRRCGLIPGGGGGGAGMGEAHPLNWRLVRTAIQLYGNTPLEVLYL